MGFMADSSGKRTRNKCALASARVSDGSTPRFLQGRLSFATVADAETVIKLTGRFLQYYRENANWLERTYKFVPRIGFDTIRAIVVDNAEGIAEQLDANSGLPAA